MPHFKINSGPAHLSCAELTRFRPGVLQAGDGGGIGKGGVMSELFDVGKRTPMKPGATPAPVGSGPEGETCKTCQHYTRVGWHDAYHLKCGLMEPMWTHGPGSDIKASLPACSKWEQPT